MLQVIEPDLHEELATRSNRWRPTNVNACVDALQQLDKLSNLPQNELERIAPLCILRAYEPGSLLYAEHSIARILFVLLHGSVALSQRDEAGNHVLLSLLGRGDIFGEGGVFGSRYRRITARADSRVMVLLIPYDELKPLLPSVPQFTKQLRLSYRERLLQTTLARVPLFANLTPLERLALVPNLDEHQIERGALVQLTTDQNTESDGLHIIAEGQAVVVRDGRRVATLNPGDFFGEMEVLHLNTPVADIVALTPLHILTLPPDTCQNFLDTHPTIAQTLRAIAQSRRAEGADEAHTLATEALIDAGVVRGQKVLARIPALCPPGCNLCERACADRHGAPRIQLDGDAFGKWDLPTGCKHCTWSPECAEACPENAIQLDNDGHLWVNDRCTGCEACVTACPYDAVTMIPLYPASANPLQWMLRKVRPPAPLRLHANKCDGCHGYDDQACLRICPTGSLRWISADELLASESNQS